jgi:DNA-binding XRE family transcriptional regulator
VLAPALHLRQGKHMRRSRSSFREPAHRDEHSADRPTEAEGKPEAEGEVAARAEPRVRRRSDFDDLLEQIEREALEEGPQGISDLQALQWKYRAVNELIERRRLLRLTQKELARRAVVSQADISKIERGRKSPTLDTYSRLAAALDIRWPSLRSKTVRRARRSGRRMAQ